MLESGVKEGGKNTARSSQFSFFREWTQQHKYEASSYYKKRNDVQNYPRGETTATVVEKNDADNNL